MSGDPNLLRTLQQFAEAVAAKTAQPTAGEPEDQLRGPFEAFMREAAAALGWDVVCTGETRLPERLGRPNYAVLVNKLLAGYVELKAPRRRREHKPLHWPQPRTVEAVFQYPQHPLYRRQRVGTVSRRSTYRQDCTFCGRCGIGRRESRYATRRLPHRMPPAQVPPLGTLHPWRQQGQIRSQAIRGNAGPTLPYAARRCDRRAEGPGLAVGSARRGLEAIALSRCLGRAIRSRRSVKWQDCPSEWQAPFRPAGKGRYFDWPLLTDLMPWQHSGVECKRTWPIAADVETLEKRWRGLLCARDRAEAFRETGDRLVAKGYPVSLTPESSSVALAELPRNAAIPPVVRYAFRSFDRQHIIADGRLMSRPRPVLWKTKGSRQIYLASSVVLELGKGPAVSVATHIPDRHYFAGRGGKDILPLYRDPEGREPNLFPCMLTTFRDFYKRKLTAEDMLAYVYGILAQPAFTAKFSTELQTRQLRVPITRKAALFEKVRAVGARLLWLHTYGERFVPKGRQPGQVPHGTAQCVKAVPGDPEGYPEKYWYSEAARTLHVGDGEFAPVARDVFEFEVSGLKVVPSWLKYRMKKGAGKKSSPLDDIRPERWTGEFTTELLELLWVLEATLDIYPEQARLLNAVISGPCFCADEFPPVPDEARLPPLEPDLLDQLQTPQSNVGKSP